MSSVNNLSQSVMSSAASSSLEIPLEGAPRIPGNVSGYVDQLLSNSCEVLHIKTSGVWIEGIYFGGLNSQRIDDEGIKALMWAMKQNTSLTHLHLINLGLNDEDIQALVLCLPLSRLTLLDLSENGFGVEGMRALAAALPDSGITQLNVSKNAIGDEGAQLLADVLTRTQITELQMRGCSIGADGMKALTAALPGCRQMTLLDLSDNLISDKEIESLATVISQTVLTQLQLSENMFFSTPFTAGLLKSSVTWLDVDCNDLRDAGAELLAAALPNSPLTYLNLTNNEISGAGSQALARALPYSQLTYLKLSCNPIGDEGAGFFAEVLPQTHLVRLDLSSSGIGDTGFQALADGLSSSASTTELDLQGNLNTNSDENIVVLGKIAGSLARIRHNAEYKAMDLYSLLLSTNVLLASDVDEKIIYY